MEKLDSQKRQAILNYLGLQQDSLPHRTVVDDCLAYMNPDEINDLLIILFNWAKRNKIFYNHAESLLPNNHFHLACDGVWVHKYSKPHAINKNGENICPYCLPRVRNKGKEDEVTYWLHTFVNFAMIFPGGLQLPVYIYPLKSAQIQLEASESEDKLKQQCELHAFHIVLPILKEKFCRLPITLLTDSLYANEPVIQLCEQLNWDYLIVRQVGSLKNIARKCDELAETELYQKSHQARQVINLKNGGKVEQTVKWFNGVCVGKESTTNVLRFEEIVKNSKGEITQKKSFKTEWLSSTPITKGNCFSMVKRGRMRADHHMH